MGKHPLWKRTETAVAARLGGTRVPINGRKGADVAHPLWAIEVKQRETIPAWLYDAIGQAVAAAEPNQLPIVVLHQKGMTHDHDLVVVQLKDWEQWHGRLSIKQQEVSL